MTHLKSEPVRKRLKAHPKLRKFPIVGIGASAGGLEAFTKLLSRLPSNTGMAFVLIQHLSPERESLLPEILAKITPMPVLEVKDGVLAEANRVYVIPPNVTMGIKEGKLCLIPRGPDERPHLAIDFFFRSLADDQKSDAIGIILSGTGSDGSEGLKAIKAAGGISFAQSPASAKFGGMPQRAIAIDHVDFILTPEEMAGELVRICKHPYLKTQSLSSQEEPEFHETDILYKILSLVKSATNVDFTQYKPTTVRRRIMRRMVVHNVETLEDYYTLLKDNLTEQISLQNDILISVTSFFRDPAVLEKMTSLVFPLLLKKRPAGESIRIWVAGCATGEEAYSFAIALLEYLGDRIAKYPVQIFASDLSDSCIAKAREGKYPDSISENVSDERLENFFHRTEKGYTVKKQVRDLCVFAKQDIVNDPPYSKLDIVSCRNVLIYFERTLQRKALAIFNYALRPEGFLILGHSETPSVASAFFTPLEKKEKIYTSNFSGAQKRLIFSRHKQLPDAVPVPATLSDPSTHMDAIEKETDRLLAEFAPPSVVIDEQLEIIQFRGDTTPFLINQPGRANFQILKMARDGLAPHLKATILNAKKGAIAKSEDLKIRTDGNYYSVSLEVIPLRTSYSKRCFLILFKEPLFQTTLRKVKAKKSTPTKASTSKDSFRVLELTRELSESKAYLESLNHDMECANQELQSANEEVLSANEELQSSNEELETAKEELQSGNEELTTVNDELQNRNLELDHLNDDLVNLLASADIPIIMIEKNGRIRRITPSAAKAFSLQASDVGRPMREIKSNFEVLKLDLDLEKKVNEVVESMIPTETEIQDRNDRWFRLQIRPYRTIDNKIDGAVVALVNIDVLKRSLAKVTLAQAEADTARLSAEAGNRAKDIFLATLSHELRTPLTTVLAYAQLLRLGKLNPEAAKKAVQIIEQSAQAQNSLINDLLDVSRIIMGKLALDLQDFDIARVLHDSVLSVRPLAERKGIQIKETSLQQEVIVRADPVRLKQIFLNLLTNAIKFSRSEGIIEVNMECLSDSGEELVRVSIRDFGKGIAEAFLPNLFERFSQADSSSTRVHGGMGLGLAIVKSLTESQGGKVSAESQGIGKGSTFALLFPRSSSDLLHQSLNALSISTRPPKSQKDATADYFSIKGLRILLVDDDPGARDSIATLLSFFEAIVHSADSAQAGMNALDTFRPDILLSDMAMPVEDGCAFIRRVRKLLPDSLGTIPAVVLTAYSTKDDIERALKAGFQAYLAKPVDCDQLVKVISETAKAKIQG